MHEGAQRRNGPVADGVGVDNIDVLGLQHGLREDGVIPVTIDGQVMTRLSVRTLRWANREPVWNDYCGK